MQVKGWRSLLLCAFFLSGCLQLQGSQNKSESDLERNVTTSTGDSSPEVELSIPNLNGEEDGQPVAGGPGNGEPIAGGAGDDARDIVLRIQMRKPTAEPIVGAKVLINKDSYEITTRLLNNDGTIAQPEAAAGTLANNDSYITFTSSHFVLEIPHPLPVGEVVGRIRLASVNGAMEHEVLLTFDRESFAVALEALLRVRVIK